MNMGGRASDLLSRLQEEDFAQHRNRGLGQPSSVMQITFTRLHGHRIRHQYCFSAYVAVAGLTAELWGGAAATVRIPRRPWHTCCAWTWTESAATSNARPTRR